jgi:hypothetical protein
MSFTINGFVVAQNETLIITGQPDGGSVCQSRDDGQPHTYTGDFGNGSTYTETMVFKCSGTYKGGQALLYRDGHQHSVYLIRWWYLCDEFTFCVSTPGRHLQ